MGVLQRFERRLEGLVEGTFARIFKGAVQPVEIAAALQKEAADKKAIVGAGRVLVPNAYVVELGQTDAARLSPYDRALRDELGSMVGEHAQEQGWSFVGPVDVRFQQADDLGTGVFRVRSTVAGAPSQVGNRSRAAHPARPRLVIMTTGRAAQPVDGEQSVPVGPAGLVIGRGGDVDLNLADPGISRRHAEVRYDGVSASLLDLSSTNGTTVNGRRVDEAQLQDGDRIGIGGTSLVYRQGA